MTHKSIALWEDGSESNLATYVLNNNKNNKARLAVLICPGGGYNVISKHETEAIAMQFNAAGFHAFVLYYGTHPKMYRQPLMDVSKAMCLIRENAAEWNVDPDKIAVAGFSAGGHLAAGLGVHWEKPFLKTIPGVEKQLNKPNALILAYPVITSGEFATKASFKSLLGNDYDNPAIMDEMSLEKQVNINTPPAFLWHTFDDELVLVENSLLFANALRKNKIPFELHIYPEGVHGLSLATTETGVGDVPHVATWMWLCIGWLNNLFKSNG